MRFTQILTYLVSVVYILLFKDINECNELHPCDKFAECVNTEPGYQCECMDGYHSNGHDSCSGKTMLLYLVLLQIDNKHLYILKLYRDECVKLRTLHVQTVHLIIFCPINAVPSAAGTVLVTSVEHNILTYASSSGVTDLRKTS